eukprot:jgi/Chrpa1/20225/Chrysochromulina_OHIO_Genome00017364-RA
MALGGAGPVAAVGRAQTVAVTAEAVTEERAMAEARVEAYMAAVMVVVKEEVGKVMEETEAVRVEATRVAVVRVRAEAAMAAGAAGARVVATGTAAHWAADRMTAAPPPGMCSGRSAGGGGGEAARVMRATMLPRKPVFKGLHVAQPVAKGLHVIECVIECNATQGGVERHLGGHPPAVAWAARDLALVQKHHHQPVGTRRRHVSVGAAHGDGMSLCVHST